MFTSLSANGVGRQREPFAPLSHTPCQKDDILKEGYSHDYTGHASVAKPLQKHDGESALDGTNNYGTVKRGALNDTSASTPFTSDSTLPKQVSQQRTRRIDVDLGYGDQRPSAWSTLRRVMTNIWLSVKMIRLFFFLAWLDIKRRTCSYCLGFGSVVVVVLLCVLMISLLTHMPILFLSLSEAQAGEYDVAIWPSPSLRAVSVNYARIKELYPDSHPDYGLSAPRFRDVYSAVAFRGCVGKSLTNMWASDDGSRCETPEDCMRICSSEVITNLALIAIDTEAEARMQFGTDYTQPTPQKGELILSRSAALEMGSVSVGDVVVLFGTAQNKIEFPFSQIPQRISPYTIMSFRVISIMDISERKFPGEEMFAVVSFNTFLKDVAEGLGPNTSPEAKELFALADVNQCATTIFFKMRPSFRLKAYSSTDFNAIRTMVNRWTSDLLSPIGYMQFERVAAQLYPLYRMRLLSVFLGLIISLIILAMVFLSIVLVYSLLTVGIETKTHELGIHRMVGFTKENLVMMVLINAYSFTLPAWIIGIGLGQACYSGARSIFLQLVNMELPVSVSGPSVGWATLAGLSIPVVGSLFPILSLVTQRLPDALNTSRSRSVGVIIRMSGGDSTRLSWTMLGIGVVFFLIGFLVYFLLPISMIEMNLNLIFYIFFGLLAGLLGGFVMLATSLERVVQTCFSYALLFWESGAVFSFMLKSLSAHRLRNRKTTLMYAFSLAFVIFITVAVNLVLLFAEYGFRQASGCEVRVRLRNIRFPEYGAIDALMNAFKETGFIDDYTYDYIHPTIGTLSYTRISSLGRLRSASTSLIGLPPNYFEALDSRFLSVDQRHSTVGRFGLSGSLYSAEGLNRGIISSGVARNLGIGVEDGVGILQVGKIANATLRTFMQSRSIARTLATLDSAPVFSLSKYTEDFSELLMSIPSLLWFVNGSGLSVNQGSVETVRIRVNSEDRYEEVADAVARGIVGIGLSGSVETIRSQTEGLSKASQLLNLCFLVTEIMILIICFFSLMSSMSANVLNSSKEIGVLLCMGMSHFQIYRVYFWEAFILLISAGIMGLFVGTIVAYTMLLQNSLLSQLTVPFPFPYPQLILVLVLGFISSFASSFSSVAYLLNQPSITHILRRTI